MAKDKVFISYRRDTGQDIARGLNDRLRQQGIDTFFDRETLHSGKFNQQLLKAIKECSDFIFVYSDHALDRCANDGDWVRTEIETAMKENKNILIVYTFQPLYFPDTLPHSMAEFPNYHGVYFNQEYYNEGIKRITGELTVAKSSKFKKLILPIIAAVVLICAAVAFFKNTDSADKNEPITELQAVEEAVTETETPAQVQPTKKSATSQRTVTSEPAQTVKAEQTETPNTTTAAPAVQTSATAPVTTTSETATATEPVQASTTTTTAATTTTATAETTLQQKADSGDAEAACQLGLMYLNGNGVKKSFKSAFNYFNQAASAGNVEAMYWLGWCYRMGRGTSKDFSQARQWWTKAANAGSSKAASGLAEIQSLM